MKFWGDLTCAFVAIEQDPGKTFDLETVTDVLEVGCFLPSFSKDYLIYSLVNTSF